MTMETGSQVGIYAGAASDDHPNPNAVDVSRIKEGTRKRLYEHGEDEQDDREMDKLYKRDYWEDPAYASLLELSSLGIARAEAILCFSERVLRATDAKLAQRRQERERRRCRADDDDDEPEPEQARAAGGGRLFLCFWRSIVDNLAALLHYFLG